MKAVFVKQECLVEKAPPSPTGELQLRPGVAEGLRTLADDKLFLIVLDVGSCAVEPEALPAKRAQTQRLLQSVRTQGGRVDALMQCPHRPSSGCGCWSTYPGFLQAAAVQLDLRLEECYLICDQPNDVTLAYRVGCRPILILDGRTLGDLYDGHQPEPRDFPVARDFSSAVHYVLTEEEAAREWGYARRASVLPQFEETSAVGKEHEFTPTLKLFSPVPGVRGLLLYGFPQASRSARQWLAAFVIGGVGLSLGIAYLLVDLYRRQPFPEFVYYLTLQFIPRAARGLLFILVGVAVVALSLRAILRLFPSNGGRR